MAFLLYPFPISMTTRTIALFSASLLLFACAPATPPTAESGDQRSSVATMEDSSSSIVIMEPGADGQEDSEDDIRGEKTETSEPVGDDDTMVSAGVTANVPVPSPRVVTISASNFQFSPKIISVKKGEQITLRLQGKEGKHGFAIAGLGINTPVSAGKTIDVTLPTDAAGTFTFRCSVPCGSGHRDMTGTITVAE